MFLTLGNIKFEGIKLPLSWEGSYESSYAQIPIIGSKPVVQATGQKPDEYDITAFFHADFCNPRTEVDALQAIRKAAEVNYLVDGTGRNYGRFVISTLSESKVTSLDNGYPTSITVQMHLLEYNTNKSVLKKTGKALTSNAPVKMELIAPKKTVALTIDNSMQAGNLATLRMQDAIKNYPTPTSGKFSQIAGYAATAKKAYTDVQNSVEQTKKLVYKAYNLYNSITNINSALTAIENAANIQDVDSLLTANQNVSDAMYYLKTSYAPVVAFLGSREGGED